MMLFWTSEVCLSTLVPFRFVDVFNLTVIYLSSNAILGIAAYIHPFVLSSVYGHAIISTLLIYFTLAFWAKYLKKCEVVPKCEIAS